MFSAIVVTSLLFCNDARESSSGCSRVCIKPCYLLCSYKTGSILPGIAIHFLNNSFAMIEGSFLVDDQISTVFIIIEVLCMLYAFFMLYQKRIAIRNYIIHNRGYRIRVFFGNWMSILFLIFCIVAIISALKFCKVIKGYIQPPLTKLYLKKMKERKLLTSCIYYASQEPSFFFRS